MYMARPLRVEYEGAYYHVMSRGSGRQNVFHSKQYYVRFLSCLEQAHRRFALECHAYCLMGNKALRGQVLRYTIYSSIVCTWRDHCG